jgi:hypothetical protein
LLDVHCGLPGHPYPIYTDSVEIKQTGQIKLNQPASFAETAIILMSIKAIIYKSLFAVYDFCVRLVLFRRTDLTICSGPFAGMRYGATAVGSSLTPKLFGTYEMELAQIVDQLPVFDFTIDVGAAEGWYAVGLLYRKKTRKVVAFELDEKGREACHANAVRNGVTGQIDIRGQCRAPEFQALLQSLPDKKDGILIVSDCEGFEDELLAGETIKLCRRAYFLVETHDSIVPGVHTRLLERLGLDHVVTQIARAKRTRDEIKPASKAVRWLLKLPFLYRLFMAERRGGGNAWIYAAPKTNAR